MLCYSISFSKNPPAFELFFCWANAEFFTFSSNPRSLVPTSNLCRNIQRPKSVKSILFGNMH